MQLKCPKCGNTDVSQMKYLEDIVNFRAVKGIDENGQLIISGHYETREGYDDGHNARLECDAFDINTGQMCLHEFPIPEELGVDFE